MRIKIGSREIDEEEFRRIYPNLARELLDHKPQAVLTYNGVEDPWRGYEPGVLDFIARAESLEEAYEVIDYLERRKEITPEEARFVRERLSREGLRAFGPLRKPGFYFKAAGYK